MRLEDLPDDADHCAHCGTELPQDVYWGRRIYCSTACNVAAQVCRDKDARLAAKEGRTCKLCGGPISPYKPNYAVYCGSVCQRAASGDRIYRFPTTCEKCGQNFDAPRETSRFCSQQCAAAASVKERRPCAWCGKPIKSHKKRVRFCSTDCYGASRKGKSRPSRRHREPARSISSSKTRI